MGIGGTYLNIIKPFWQPLLTANIQLNGEKLKVFSLSSETRPRMKDIHLALLFNRIMEVLDMLEKKEKWKESKLEKE